MTFALRVNASMKRLWWFVTYGELFHLFPYRGVEVIRPGQTDCVKKAQVIRMILVSNSQQTLKSLLFEFFEFPFLELFSIGRP